MERKGCRPTAMDRGSQHLAAHAKQWPDIELKDKRPIQVLARLIGPLSTRLSNSQRSLSPANKLPPQNFNTTAATQSCEHKQVFYAFRKAEKSWTNLELQFCLNNTRKSILTVLARNIGKGKDHASEHNAQFGTCRRPSRTSYSHSQLKRKIQKRKRRGKSIHSTHSPLHPRAMAQAYHSPSLQYSIGFAELAISISHEHSANTIPVLIDPKDVPHIDFDSSLA